jgi:hypothetical protein
VADLAARRDAPKQTGLAKDHPLLSFFAKDGATLGNYLALDDLVVMGGIESMTRAADMSVSELAKRLRARRLYKTLDMGTFGADEGKQRQHARRIDRSFETEIGTGVVLKDEDAQISIYTQIGGDDDRTHKKLHMDDAGSPRKISEISDLIKSLAAKRTFTRYYFEQETDRDMARRGRREP